MLCLSPLVILGLESYFSGSSNPNELVKVGDESISRTAYQEMLDSRRRELIKSGIDPSLINNSVLSDEVLDSLIAQALLKNQAQTLGFYVSDKVINDILLKDPQFKDAAGNFSNERFAFVLKQQRMTKDQLFNDYRHQLNVSKLYDSVAQTAVYPSNGVDQLLAWQQETRNVWLHRLPWQDFASQVSVSEKDIAAYYDTHKHDLKSLAMVDLAYVVLDPTKIATEAVSEADIRAEYDAFKANYSSQYAQKVSQILITGDKALDTVNSVQQRLKKGESFAALAKALSADPVSRMNGGDIGTFNPAAFGMDADKVAQALDGLTVGQVSQPVKTSYGYQIFKVTAIEGEAVPSFAAMHAQLKERAAQQKKAALIGEKITRINEMAIDGMSAADIAEQEGLPLQKIANYPKQDNHTALNQPAVIDAAFDEMRLQDESVSTSITVNNDTIWLQPTHYRPVAPLSLQQASAGIKKILTKQAAIALAATKAKEMAQQINASGAGIQALNVAFTPLGEVTRQSTVLMPEEKTVVFAQEAAMNKEVKLASKTRAVAQSTPQGASVLVINTVKNTAPQPVTAAQRQQTLKEVSLRRGQEDFADYLEYLKMAIDVTKNDSMLADMAGL